MDANAPYLPPEQPSDNPPQQQKRRNRRTIVLWLVLIVMFIAIYQFLSVPPPHGAQAAPPPPASDWSAWWTFAPSLLVLAAFIVFLRMQLRGGSKLNRKLEPGLLALADGDLGRAADVFSAVAREYKQQTTYAGVARLSLATALMRQGELQKAIDGSVEVERAPGLLFGSEVRTAAAINLALLYTLRGQLDAAERWCDDARKRLSRAGGAGRTPAAAQLRLAEIALLARRDQRDEAARALDRDWRRLEESLTAQAMKKAWLMRAFVAAEAGPRSAMAPSLVRKGELGWMATDWPELRAFMDAHDL